MRIPKIYLDFALKNLWVFAGLVFVVVTVIMLLIIAAVSDHCSFPEGLGCNVGAIDAEVSSIFLDIKNNYAGGIYIDRVKISGPQIQGGCLIDPETGLLGMTNPLKPDGLHLSAGDSAEIPVLCKSQLKWDGDAEFDIVVRLRDEGTSHSEILTGILVGEVDGTPPPCPVGWIYLTGLDGTGACCNNVDCCVLGGKCQPGKEVCGDKADNDCDGITDDGCTCDPDRDAVCCNNGHWNLTPSLNAVHELLEPVPWDHCDTTKRSCYGLSGDIEPGQCCGDDAQEFYIAGSDGSAACCDSGSDCVIEGVCGSGEEICGDGRDNDCDGVTDDQDDDCWCDPDKSRQCCAGINSTLGADIDELDRAYPWESPGRCDAAQSCFDVPAGDSTSRSWRGGCCGDDANEFFVRGSDGTFACCDKRYDLVFDSECTGCPEDKPNFVILTQFTEGLETELLLEGVEPYRVEAGISLPCRSDIAYAYFDVSNARPYKNFRPQSASVVFVVDISESMTYRMDRPAPGAGRECNVLGDAAADRWSVASCLLYNPLGPAALLRRMATNRSGNLLGLVAFNSQGYILSYLTEGFSHLERLTSQLEPRGTSDLQAGIEKAVKVLGANNPNRNNHIVLLTGGEEDFGDADAYVCEGDFPRSSVAIHTIAVGPAGSGRCGQPSDDACRTLTNLVKCTGGTESEASPSAFNELLSEIFKYREQDTYPSDLLIAGLRYPGELRGSDAEPAYLEPAPDITALAKGFSDSCPGSRQTLSVIIESTDPGYLMLSNLTVAACTP
ncbi:MAG: vWA domain-containing protein [archaeon]